MTTHPDGQQLLQDLTIAGKPAYGVNLHEIIVTHLDTVVFRTLLGELELLCEVPTPVHVGEEGDTEQESALVHENNSSAVIIVRDRLYGARTKFLDVRLRVLRERERDRVLSLTLVGTRDQLADALTKQLGKHDFMLWREILLNGGMLDGGARVSTTTNAKGE